MPQSPILLDFLFAADGTPLRKTRNEDGTLEPYPMVRDFVSLRHEADSLLGHYDAMVEVAEQGGCLLKGLLDRQLKGESRAGHTNATDTTRWVCLDLDFDGGFEDHDDFMSAIGLGDVSYIVQWSASATSTDSLRGHIFFELAEPAVPQTLKLWLRKLNLELEELSHRIELTASGIALRYPLDITTCQNDKLLFIAHPDGWRGELRKRRRDKATLRLGRISPSRVEKMTLQRLNELRKEADLKPLSKTFSTLDPVAADREAIVTGVKKARGFVYLNLNGGDSWGYFFPENNPEVLYNFKGEPPVTLRTLAPELYHEYKNRAELADSDADTPRDVTQELDEGPIVIRDFATGKYFAVRRNPQGEIELGPVRSRNHIQDVYGDEDRVPAVIPNWSVEFDPTTLKRIDEQTKWINEFKPSPYLKGEAFEPCSEVPTTIHKVIWSAVGNDAECYDHFLNWLAFVFQTRRKTKTAWVLHGRTGTGKGTLFNNIIAPLFGREYCPEITLQALLDQFNNYMRTALFVMVDEIKINSGREAFVEDKLKHIITEEYPVIRAMQTDHRTHRSFTNLILTTNRSTDPIPIAPDDRRFNVAPPQREKLELCEADFEAIEQELPAFAGYLKQYNVDVERVRRPLNNLAKLRMQRASEPAHQQILRAFRDGDLTYFMTMAHATVKDSASIARAAYMASLKRWLRRRGATQRLSVSEVQVTYQYLTGTTIPPAKFMRMLEANSIPMAKRLGEPQISVKWEALDDVFVQRASKTLFNNEALPVADKEEDCYEMLD